MYAQSVTKMASNTNCVNRERAHRTQKKARTRTFLEIVGKISWLVFVPSQFPSHAPAVCPGQNQLVGFVDLKDFKDLLML